MNKDLIYRQAAIEGFFALDIEIRPSVIDAFLNMIRAIPPEEPGIDEWCTGCKEYDTERNCCPRYGRVIKSALKCLEWKWTPCTAELPEPGKMVLVTTRTKKGRRDINRAYYMNGSWHGAGSMAGVVAWMPMPEPWEGGTE